MEYYIADNDLSRMAEALAKDAEVKGQKEKARRYKEDARLFYNSSLGYKHYYSKEYGTFPVSYTHLDVYKRQLLLLGTVFSCTQAEQDYASYVNPFIGTGGHGHTSVSYTHLDVYKRQYDG